jgi:ribosome-binding factor A
MVESKRQKQVAKVIQAEMNQIFQYLGIQTVGKGGMVSISKVVVTPDLLESRIYLSLFQIPDSAKYLEEMNERIPEFRGMLGNRIKTQLRRIPTVAFYLDDTLDYVFKMEEIFSQLEKERNEKIIPNPNLDNQ